MVQFSRFNLDRLSMHYAANRILKRTDKIRLVNALLVMSESDRLETQIL